MTAKLSQKRIGQLITVTKIIVIVSILLLLYFKLKDQDDLIGKLKLLVASTVASSWYLFIIVILLMPINWLLEAYKWQLLNRKLKHITIWQSFKGVLIGLTLGFITPHAVGDYFGRILSSAAEDRLRLVGAIFLGRLSQMMATCLFGLVGVYYLFGAMPMLYGLLIILFFTFLIRLAVNKSLNIRIGKYISIINEYSAKQLALIQAIALARYVVFCLQFCLLLYAFLPDISYLLNFSGVTWIFLAKSVLPSFNFLSDLGIREYSAVYFFEQFDIAIIPIISASLLIWVINILTPTLVGLPFVLQLKWSRS